ncbi:MAG: hypothetical protein DHS20C17_16850 [Cyclobacteriaceae bacterium]|nr:MAG: hypothetical protein DHS20C17_16850 [Cyclobacteriaceae bacterium]
MIAGLTHRSFKSEIMDDLQCGGTVLDQSLKELEIINRLLGGNSLTIDGIDRLQKSIGHPGRKLTICDLGCGGGDMLKLVLSWARENNIQVELTGIDANPNVIQYAIQNCRSEPEIKFLTLDVFSKEFNSLQFDIILSTLFFHHFDNQQLAGLFRTLSNQCRVGLVVNDLHRHWLAYYSIKVLTRIFSKSSMVRNDAPLSVQRSFIRSDILALMASSGIKNFQLRWKWAFRWQLLITRS